MVRRIAIFGLNPIVTLPRSGGDLRSFHLYAALAQRFQIDLVSWTYADRRSEAVTIAPGFTNYVVPRPPVLDSALRRLAELGITGQLFNIAVAMAGRGDTPFHAIGDTLAEAADCIIHETPYSLLYDRRFGLDGKPRLYNSHNFEADLAGSLSTHPDVQDFVDMLERTMARASDAVFATSETEAQKFRWLYGVQPRRLHLCRNGFVAGNFDGGSASGSERPKAVFIGSRHPPNISAASFILRDLAPSFPAVSFVIAGEVCRELQRSDDRNLTLLGEVDEAGKRHLFRAGDIFLNPLSAGAGTSIKAIEAMAAGMAMLTTPIGGRGLDLANGRDALVAELTDFESALSLLLDRPMLRFELGDAARAKTAALSWTAIADRTADIIDRICDAQSMAEPDPPLDLLVGAGDIPAEPGYDTARLQVGDVPIPEIRATSDKSCDIHVPADPEHVLTRLFRTLSARATRTRFLAPNLLKLAAATGLPRHCALDPAAPPLAVPVGRRRPDLSIIVAAEHFTETPTIRLERQLGKLLAALARETPVAIDLWLTGDRPDEAPVLAPFARRVFRAGESGAQRLLDASAGSDAVLLEGRAVEFAPLLQAAGRRCIILDQAGLMRTGLDPAEFLFNPATDRAFRRIHAPERPFFLVLGPISSDSRCDLIAAAHDRLSGLVDLVLIGRGDIGLIPRSPLRHVYGWCEREEVLGALRRCIAVLALGAGSSANTTILEAWMSDRPVIAGPASLLVTHGVNGYGVGTESDLAEAMNHLATHPNLAADLGRAGRAQAESRSWRHTAHALFDLLASSIDS